MARRKVTYPIFPQINWWKLREIHKQKIPDKITASDLAQDLDVEDGTARNIFGHLKRLELVDNAGRTTGLLRRWIDDSQYPQVCKELREKFYPASLRHSFSDSDYFSEDSLTQWFVNDTGLSKDTTRGMAAFYLLLCKAKPNNTGHNLLPKRIKDKTSEKGAITEPIPSNNYKQADLRMTTAQVEERIQSSQLPLYINIQIHIPPDASREQIDYIFASMAKHLTSLQKQESK